MFVCLDDKHRVKVGKQGFPVAAAERGRQVLQAARSRFLVGEHDFTKLSIIPLVALQLNIPNDISESWYSGKVNTGLLRKACLNHPVHYDTLPSSASLSDQMLI